MMLTFRFPLGTYFGIGLFVHWTFLLLLAWVAWFVHANEGTVADILEQEGLVLCVFLCVTLHEYGHALAARSFGISTRDITLLPIGGVAMLERIPRQPIQELLIALAGPAVNVVIAFCIFSGLLLTGTGLQDFGADKFLHLIFWVNLYLVLFNMIPAFPMDGGRVLRSLLAMRLPYAKATRWAGRTGWILAPLLALAGLVYLQDVRVVLLAMFVLWAGTMEVRQVMWRERVLGIRVHQVMQTRFRVIEERTPVGQILAETIGDLQKDWPVVADGMYRGMLRGSVLMEAASASDLEREVRDLPLASITPLWLDEPLEHATGQGRQTRILPVVDHRYHVVGLIDLDVVAERVEMQRALPPALVEAMAHGEEERACRASIPPTSVSDSILNSNMPESSDG